MNQSNFLKIISGLVKRIKTTFINHGIPNSLFFPWESSLHKKTQSNLSCAWNARKSRTTWFTEQRSQEYSGAAFMELCAPTLFIASLSRLTAPPRRRPPAKERVPVLPTLTLFIFLHFCFSHQNVNSWRAEKLSNSSFYP